MGGSTTTADDLQSTATFGHHLYIRGHVLELGKILYKQVLPQKIRYLHLYCQDLTWGSERPPQADGTVDLGITDLKGIYIFAQCFLTTSNLPKGLIFSAKKSESEVNRFGIWIYHDTCPRGLLVGHRGFTPVNIQRTSTATYAGLSATKIVISHRRRRFLEPLRIQNVPQGELASPSQAALAKSSISVPSNLLVVLTAIFKDATSNIFGNAGSEKDIVHRQQRVMSSMAFVARCSRGSEASLSLADSANRICSRMQLPRLFPMPTPLAFAMPEPLFEVPVLQLERYTELVPPLVTTLEHLESLKTLLEQQQKLHAGLVKLDQAQADNTKTLLDNMARAATSFVNTDADVKEAKIALQTATDTRAALKVRQTTISTNAGKTLTSPKEKAKEVVATKDAFEKDMEAWQSKIDAARTTAAVKGGFGLVAKGLTAIFDPPSIADFFTSVLDEVDKCMDELDAQDETAAAFKEFFKKFPALLDDLKHANTSFSDMPKSSVLDSLNAKTATEELNKIFASPVDYLGLLVRYEEFAKQSATAFKDVSEAIKRAADAVSSKSLKTNKIAAFDNCAESLESMVIRGKAVVEADRLAQEQTITYLRGVVENSKRKAVGEKISAAKSRITTSVKTSDNAATKEALEQLRLRMPDVKYQLFAAVFEGLISYNYRAGTGRSSHFVDVNVDSDALAYATAYNKIKSTLNQSDESLFNLLWCPDVLVATTADTGPGQTFQADWKQALRRDGTVPFTIPLTHPDLDGWSYLRTNLFYATFYAANDVVLNDVEYWITFGPHFFDRNETNDQFHYMMKPSTIIMVDKEGGKVDTKSFILPTPSCTGTLQFSRKTKHRNMFEVANLDRLVKIAVKVKFMGLRKAAISSRAVDGGSRSTKVAQDTGSRGVTT